MRLKSPENVFFQNYLSNVVRRFSPEILSSQWLLIIFHKNLNVLGKVKGIRLNIYTFNYLKQIAALIMPG